MITIIDYGLGNLGSIQNMLKKIGTECKISNTPQELQVARKLILPGVGAFDAGMRKIHQLGLFNILQKKILEEKTPILGICLGMQLLSKSSEEGVEKGLGWIDAHTRKFQFSSGHENKIPHMGWNTVQLRKESPLFRNMFTENRFYFVHSYHVVCENPEDILLETCYGYPITAALEKENIVGVQFHLEKSHKYGMQLLKNFVEVFRC